MRLLIITQKVDKNDPVLGFFHGWIEKFAQKTEKVFVIANCVGEYNLPENVEVFSVGKEKGYSKLHKIFRFVKFLYQNSKKFDSVFFHMCPEYVLASLPVFVVFKKRTILWYVHKKVSWKLRLAAKFVDQIFTVSEKSINLKSPKIIAVGHGINLDLFKKRDDVEAGKNSILYLGRISPVKNLEVLVRAEEILEKRGIGFKMNIVGNPVNQEDFEYKEKLKKIAGEKVSFLPGVKNTEAPEVYSRHKLFVNLTSTGSFDKAILEAMACENLVVVCNESFVGILPPEFIFKENDVEDMAVKIENVLKLNQEETKNYGRKFRQYVVENHNLEKLVQKIVDCFK